jgi:DNA-directed RNA polymerase specialized sigma24 family protein
VASPDSNPPVGHITTRWSLLDALDGPEADAAWRHFVDRYRPFVRGVLQRSLASAEAAQHAEPEFWGYVYLSEAIRRADRGRRFRPFLSGIVHRFAQSWRRKQSAGSSQTGSDLPAQPTPGAAEAELADWARNVLDLARTALAAEWPEAEAALRRFYGLGTDTPACEATELANALGTTVGGVYQLLSRGRRRLRALVEAELRDGCADGDELADEVRIFLQNLAGRHPGLFPD